MVHSSGWCGFWMINNPAEKFLWSRLTWDTSGMSVCSTERVWISNPQSKFPPPHGDEAIPADPTPTSAHDNTEFWSLSMLQAFVWFSLKAAIPPCFGHCNPRALASEWLTVHVGYMQYSKLQPQDWLLQATTGESVSESEHRQREGACARDQKQTVRKQHNMSTIWGTECLYLTQLFILLSVHYCFGLFHFYIRFTFHLPFFSYY